MQDHLDNLNFDAYIQEQQWQQADEAAFLADAARAAEQVADYDKELAELKPLKAAYLAMSDAEKLAYRTEWALSEADVEYYGVRIAELDAFVTAARAEIVRFNADKAAKAAEKAVADAARLAAAATERAAAEEAARTQGVKDRKRALEKANKTIADLTK